MKTLGNALLIGLAAFVISQAWAADSEAAANPSGGFFLDRQPKDKTELIEYNFDTSPTLNVPGDWNSQREKLFYYEGSVWYRTKFVVNKSAPGHRLFVYSGAVNYEADVYVNGRKLSLPDKIDCIHWSILKNFYGQKAKQAAAK